MKKNIYLNYIIKRAMVLFIITSLVLFGYPGTEFINDAYENIDTFENASIENDNLFIDLPNYIDYLNGLNVDAVRDKKVIVDVEKYNKSESSGIINIKSFKDDNNIEKIGLHTNEDGKVTWEVNVENAGLYNIKILYLNVFGKGSSILRTIEVNGKVPYREAQSVVFQRVFENESEMEQDLLENDIRPSQIEKLMWQENFIYDSLGYYNEPLLFNFEEGINTISFLSIREPLVICGISLEQYSKPLPYSDIEKYYSEKGYNNVSNLTIIVEGEDAKIKSSRNLFPINDNSSPLTSPAHHRMKKLNIIGGQRWQSVGQWLEWEFESDEEGLYILSFKARQNIISGKPSYRKVYINGEVPFESLENFKFPHTNQWGIYSSGIGIADINESNILTENMQYVYLKKGTNTIRMEVVTGEISSIVQRLDESIRTLNKVYLDLLIYLGPSPDIYRDYNFEARMPGTLTTMKQQISELNTLADEYDLVQGEISSHSQQIRNFSKLLNRMVNNTDRIASSFGDFVNNISALGSLINTLLNQPLEIDYILFTSPDVQMPQAQAGFFEQIGFMFKQFISSFFIDYSAIGVSSKGDESITVWMTAGRDQANALNQLIINNLTRDKGINVRLELVPPGTLLPATLAGKGPDVSLNNAQSDPLNYAIRGAVKDLKTFNDVDEVEDRFTESALIPLKFEGALYGLPETLSFPVLFYRNDILDMLGINVPQTWDDVLEMLPILQRNNMNFALPQPFIGNITGAGFSTYVMFLNQYGGNLYNQSANKALLDSNEAIDAFFMWVNFFNEHSLPVAFDFVSRFRTGEIPIGIADYNMYNILSVFAPELNGVWSFGLVPGTIMTDGGINNSVASTITASVIMENCRKPELAWEFLKWWVSAETQSLYGNEIESIMGTAGRYQTANIEAFYGIPWATKDFEILSSQWERTVGIREVPGSYMTPRYVDFAFKQAFTGTNDMKLSALIDPGEIIQRASRLINDEILYKRTEFGLTE